MNLISLSSLGGSIGRVSETFTQSMDFFLFFFFSCRKCLNSPGLKYNICCGQSDIDKKKNKTAKSSYLSLRANLSLKRVSKRKGSSSSTRKNKTKTKLRSVISYL